MIRQNKSAFLSARIMITAVVSVLLLSVSPVVQAEQQSTSDSEWSSWKPLSNGYMARRRVPNKMNMPVTERRLENVQERLPKVKELQERLLAREIISEKGSGRQQRLSGIQTRLKRLVTRINQLVQRRSNEKSLWFHTGSAGLYTVSIEELAENLALPAEEVARNLRQGRAGMKNGGNPVLWYFDEATDSILFAAEEYETFYTDQNAYQFKFGHTGLSEAMPVIDGAPEGSAGEALPFIDTLTFEEEPDFFYSTWTVASEQDADYWFWDYLYGGYKDQIEITLDIPHPAARGTAHLSITMRGWTDLEAGDEHRVAAELNGQPVGSMISWDGFDEATLEADFDQSLLNEDGSNALTIHNSYTLGTHPGEWLDQVDVVYSRMPVAVNDALRLHEVVGGSQIVTGLTSDDILVMQDPADEAAMLGDIQVDDAGDGTWSVSFNAVEGANYFVADRSTINTPMITPDTGARLTKRSNTADYLIIAPRAFAGTAEALVQYQQDRFEAVKIVWLDDIYNEFSYGFVDPTAISRFMQHAGNWRISPSYVVLVGKGSLDEKNRMGYSDSFLPVLMTSTPWALAASDDRLLGIEDTASFAVGRIPITTDSEGLAYVDKLRAHESATPGVDLFQAVLAADNPDDAGDFYLNSDLLADQLLDSYGFTGVKKFYHPQDNVRALLILSDTWEAGYVGYDGHGSVAQIGDYRENFLTVVDAAALQNSRYPVFTALTCAVADDTLPGTRSLAGVLVLNDSGGAIASVAPTGLSLDADAQMLGSAFVESLYNNTNTTIGDALIEAKMQSKDSISDFMPRIYEVVGDPSVYAR